MKTREDKGILDVNLLPHRLREISRSSDVALQLNQPERERLCAKLVNKMLCEIRTIENEVRFGATDGDTICEMCAKTSGYAAMLRSEYEANDFPLT